MNIQHHASFQEKQQIYYTFPLQRFLNYIHYIFAHTNTDVLLFFHYTFHLSHFAVKYIIRSNSQFLFSFYSRSTNQNTCQHKLVPTPPNHLSVIYFYIQEIKRYQ